MLSHNVERRLWAWTKQAYQDMLQVTFTNINAAFLQFLLFQHDLQGFFIKKHWTLFVLYRNSEITIRYFLSFLGCYTIKLFISKP